MITLYYYYHIIITITPHYYRVIFANSTTPGVLRIIYCHNYSLINVVVGKDNFSETQKSQQTDYDLVRFS